MNVDEDSSEMRGHDGGKETNMIAYPTESAVMGDGIMGGTR